MNHDSLYSPLDWLQRNLNEYQHEYDGRNIFVDIW